MFLLQNLKKNVVIQPQIFWIYTIVRRVFLLPSCHMLRIILILPVKWEDKNNSDPKATLTYPTKFNEDIFKGLF